MVKKVEEFLKKINYIEADIEIHKQILFSIPSVQKDEIEKTLKIIASKKAMVKDLREEIKAIDPEEFNQILLLEKASEEFGKLAAKKKFIEISTPDGETPCSIRQRNGEPLDCLVKAKDEEGGYTVITFQGEIREFSKEEVLV